MRPSKKFTFRALLIVVVLSGVISGCANSDDPVVEGATYADLEKVAGESRDCLQNEGIVAEIDISDAGYIGTSWSSPLDKELAQEMSVIVDGCTSDLEQMNLQYLQTLVPTGADRDRGMLEMLQCLEDAGVTSILATDPQNTMVDKLVKHEVALGGDEFPFAPGITCLTKYDLLFPERLGMEPVN